MPETPRQQEPHTSDRAPAEKSPQPWNTGPHKPPEGKRREILEDIARDIGSIHETPASRKDRDRNKGDCALRGRDGLLARMAARKYRKGWILSAIEALLGEAGRDPMIEVRAGDEEDPDDAALSERTIWYRLTVRGQAVCQFILKEQRSPRQFGGDVDWDRAQEFMATIEEREKIGPVIPPATIMPPRPYKAVLEGDALGGALSAAAERVEDAKRVQVTRDAADKDPVEWCRQVGFVIEGKEGGLMKFDPWPHQVALMRMFADGKDGIVLKSRQTGVTTCLMAAASWGLVTKLSWHMHVVANKEPVAVERVLNIAKIGLTHTSLPEDVMKNLGVGGDYTTVVKYNTPETMNYIRAHAGSGGAGRSFGGNIFLMEEVADMQWGEAVYASLTGMTGDGHSIGWLVSTPQNEGEFFHRMWLEGESMGYHCIPIDWRVRPNRDEAWKKHEERRMGPRLFLQEHGLQWQVLGENQFDLVACDNYAAKQTWVGALPRQGHTYSKGIDQASTGECETVAVVIDISVKPAQVVALEVHKPKAVTQKQKADPQSQHKERTQQKIEFIEQIDAKWPGPTYIDGTNEKGTALLPMVQRRRPVHFSSGKNIKVGLDKIDNQKWWNVPRSVMVDNAATNIGRGSIILHKEHFLSVHKGIGSVRKGVDKKHGVHVDETDAFMLAGLAVRSTKRDKKGPDEQKPIYRGIKSPDILQNITGKRPGGGRSRF